MSDALPQLVVERSGVSRLKGRGTIVGGLGPRGIRVRFGDTIEGRDGDIVVFRATVRGVEMMFGSPPPPSGLERYVIQIDDPVPLGADAEFAVWLVAHREEARPGA